MFQTIAAIVVGGIILHLLTKPGDKGRSQLSVSSGYWVLLILAILACMGMVWFGRTYL